MNIVKTDLDIFFKTVTDYILNIQNTNNKVVKYNNPDQLKSSIPLKVSDNGQSVHDIMEYINQYLNYSVQTSHPQFFNQFFSGFNLPAFWGEVVAALTNTSVYTYEVAPVATLIEMELINTMCDMAGFTNGDGIFVTGGSNANLIAMLSARNKLYPQCITEGLSGLPKMSAFLSEQAHYSIENNTSLLGIGANQLYPVKTDNTGCMDLNDLQQKIEVSIQKGEVPFFLAATAGTTMLGTFDPIAPMSVIAEKYQMWFHVDGAFGGSLLFTNRAKHLFTGLEKAHSFSWDPHKLMNIPLVSSVVLLNGTAKLSDNLIRHNDDYLFHSSDVEQYDLGKKSVQCGRRVDVLKLWLSWKFYGNVGYANRMNNLLDMAAYFESRIVNDNRFQLLHNRQSLIVCFRYMAVNEMDIDDANLQIREYLRKSGLSMVNYGKVNNQFAFRWVVSNAETTKADIDLFFEHFFIAANKVIR